MGEQQEIPGTETEEKTEAPKASENSQATLEAAKAELEAARYEADKLKAQEKKRKAAAESKKREAEATKAIEDGKAKETISKLEAERSAALAELEGLRALEEKRIRSAVDALPEQVKKSVTKFADKLSLADYAELIDEQTRLHQSAAVTDNEQTSDDSSGGSGRAEPPPPATPGAAVVKRPGVRELQPQTLAMLEQYNVPREAGEQLEENDGRFGKSLKQFVKGLNERAYGGVRMTRALADQRDRERGM